MPSFDFEYLAATLKEAKENPRYSQECEAVNFFYELSMDSSCYDEETGDASEWVRHAVLFRFDRAEALWLYRHGLISQEDVEKNKSQAHLGFSVDDCGFPSVLSEDEYRSIEQAYEDAFMRNCETPDCEEMLGDENYSKCESCREQEWADEQEQERESHIQEARNRIEEIRTELHENNGHCNNCNACMINEVYCHESGCITDGEIKRLRQTIQRLEEGE